MTSSWCAPSSWTQGSTQASAALHGRFTVVSNPVRLRRRYGEEEIGVAGNATRGRHMKEPMTGRWGRSIGQGCQYAGVDEVRDAFMGDKRMKNLLLPHRIHRQPNRVLRQSMCVAHLVFRPLVFLAGVSGEGHARGCFARRSRSFLVWEQVWKVLHSWCQYDDAVAVEWIWPENERE